MFKTCQQCNDVINKQSCQTRVSYSRKIYIYIYIHIYIHIYIYIYIHIYSTSASQCTVRSCPSGSTGGNDGLRPQHLVDLLNCKESGLDLVSRLTDFVNLTLEGKCPDHIRRILFGGKLIVLRKKDGGIRPTAIGCY